MHVLIHSNGPQVQTGYGQQTDIFSRLMAADGHRVDISCFYGLQGQRVRTAPNITLYPAGSDRYGQDFALNYLPHLKPDIFVTLMDLWVLDIGFLEQAKPVSWCPIDHYPLTPEVRQRLPFCRAVWGMSRYGTNLIRSAGITDVWYVPHGIDTDVFTPIDRAEAREKLGLAQDAFVVTCTAANKGTPSRKHLPNLLKAWGAFIKTHKDAVLILHSDPRPRSHGFALTEIIKFYGIPDANIRLPDYYGLDAGLYTPASLNLMYNAGDVFVLPSAGEGFGIPAVEAQAAGSPVILTDFSAQTELCGSGWLLHVDSMDWQYTVQGAEQAHVSAKAILAALNQAYEARGDDALRARAREFALQYDHRRIYETYMKPALMGIVYGETDEQRTAARLALRAAETDNAGAPCWCDDDTKPPCCAECAYTASVGMLSVEAAE